MPKMKVWPIQYGWIGVSEDTVNKELEQSL